MYGSGPTRLAWLAVAVVLVVLFFDALLLGFAGILVAVFLRSLARGLSDRTPLSPTLALVIILLVLAGLSVLAGAKIGPDIAGEIDQLVKSAPTLAEDATSWLKSYGWGRWLLERTDDAAEWLVEPRALRGATAAVGTAIGLFGTVFVVALVGLFLAAEPRPYVAGVLRLVPVEHRPRVMDLLAQIERTLAAWLLGKLVAMAAIFIVTWVGLALIGIPIALTLALIAAALTFIPNFGPVLAAIPALLLGLQQGTSTALAVAGLYAGAQAVESYALTPLIQRKTTSLPPAFTLLAQVAMGVIAGGIGLVLATPLAAVVLATGRCLTPPVAGGVLTQRQNTAR